MFYNGHDHFTEAQSILQWLDSFYRSLFDFTIDCTKARSIYQKPIDSTEAYLILQLIVQASLQIE